MITLPVDYNNEEQLEKVFSWLSQIGASPAFGSRPIGWYQIHQCHAIDILKEVAFHGWGNALSVEVRVCKGQFQSIHHSSLTKTYWRNIGLTPRMLYDEADKRSRQ